MLNIRYELLIFRKLVCFCDTELATFLYKNTYIPIRDRET